jgi:alpha-1,2-mannosyltransferase
VPWNIVAYNVFGAASKGPDIFGTEPWHYYIRNLVLNFGIWFPLSMISIPLVLLQKLLGGQPASHASSLRLLTYLSPVYLWLAIFTVQPHKEERFMFPIYPLIALNAAVSLHVLLQIAGHIGKYQPFKHLSANIKLTVILGFLVAALVFSALRTVSLSTGYTAPLRIYEPLNQIAFPGDTVCLGKEWYRFPSSYFLPDGVQAKFIKSEFSGLLPGEFFSTNEFGAWAGTWLTPKGMNDENKEDPGKYIDISNCDFLVDTFFLSSEPTELEPDHILDTAIWKHISCEPFLDSSATGILGRLFWLPDSSLLPSTFQRKWGDYCLLQRRNL